MIDSSISVFSTCTQSKDWDFGNYKKSIVDVARWSEEVGCRGILVYTDNGIADPWLVSQVIIENTERLCPLVAIQPIYMHPYTVAKMVSTFGLLYGRRIYLNMVAGGFKNDLIALNDTTPHDLRYERLTEYTTIIGDLLRDEQPITYSGQFYQVDKLRMTPPLHADLFPGIFISGSSAAGLSTAKNLMATAIQYPKPPAEYESEPLDPSLDAGIRIGIVAREQATVAWTAARTRFPEDRKGQLTHQLAMKVSDSAWHKQLSDLAEGAQSGENPYWLIPFQNYRTNCPYLVGSYDSVAKEVARYIRVGYRTFILDIPASKEELEHIGIVFERAAAK